ncbi:MAG: hypothetical protein JO056_11675 [Alphaproteobacteria bacterium]|nr:hypothetical protein [Alphaproteobacteria bacterium]
MALAESTVERMAVVEDSFRHRVSWSATFAGAVIGTAVIFFLLMLGAGIGLSLVPAKGTTATGFLTLGAIYFLAAQAMGFAVGGHIAGRLIGPMAETDQEEEFRAAAHGLTVWGLCVTATALLILVSGWVAAGSSALASGIALAPSGFNQPGSPTVSAYWTDVLFRPAQTPMHATLGWQRYAQADTSATDATAPPDEESPSSGNTEPTQMTPVPPSAGRVENDQRTPSAATQPMEDSTAPHVITIPSGVDDSSGSSSAATSAIEPQVRNVAADKGEVGRILQVALIDGGRLSPYDQDRIAQLVSQDMGVSSADASRRVTNVQSQIRRDQAKAAEAARKVARNASLWVAFALLFGAIVATMAAISARWEDDRITFGWGRRSEPA